MHSAAAPFNSTSFQNLGFHTRRAHIHSKAPCARQECAVLLNRSRKRRGNSIQWHSDTLCHNVGGHVADAAADRVWMDGSVKSVYKEFPFQCPACLLFVCPESRLYSSLRRLDDLFSGCIRIRFLLKEHIANGALIYFFMIKLDINYPWIKWIKWKISWRWTMYGIRV